MLFWTIYSDNYKEESLFAAFLGMLLVALLRGLYQSKVKAARALSSCAKFKPWNMYDGGCGAVKFLYSVIELMAKSCECKLQLQ